MAREEEREEGRNEYNSRGSVSLQRVESVVVKNSWRRIMERMRFEKFIMK